MINYNINKFYKFILKSKLKTFIIIQLLLFNMINQDNLPGNYYFHKMKYDDIRSIQKIAILPVIGTLIKSRDSYENYIYHEHDWIWIKQSIPETLVELSKNHTLVLIMNQNESYIYSCFQQLCELLNIPLIGILPHEEKDFLPNISLFSFLFPKNDSLFINWKESKCLEAISGSSKWMNQSLVYPLSQYYDMIIENSDYIFPFDAIIKIDGNFENKKKKEVVIMVGMPGSGKSSFCKYNLPNYYLVCGDTFRTQEKMLQEGEKRIKQGSIIFDGTNGTIQKRQRYITFAKKHNCKVKCVYLKKNVNKAYQQIRKRKLEGGNYIPLSVLENYEKQLEEPTLHEEFDLLIFK